MKEPTKENTYKKTKLPQRVGRVLALVSGHDVTDAAQTLQRDLQMDSLAQVTLLLALEDEFGFVLKENDMDPYALVTVADVEALAGRYEEACHDPEEG